MSGPPPIPNEKKRLLGNPGKRALPDSRNVVSLPSAADRPPPLRLGDHGQRMWIAVLSSCPWIGQSDLLLVEQLCELEDRRMDFLETLGDSGPVLYTDKGYAYANPIVSMIDKLADQKHKIFSLLGLTPADRTRMGLAEVKAKSKLEEMMARKKAN